MHVHRRSIAARGVPRGALAACLALAGCTLEPPAPVLTGISPGWGYNGETTEVRIAGEHFYPTVIVADAGDAGARIEGTFQAWLTHDGEDIALESVQHTSYEELRADVPAGLATGSWDLRVQVPTGEVATLADAFVVTDTRADHLALSVIDASYSVGSYAAVGLSLLDPADRVVTQPFEVEVRAEAASLGSSMEGVSFYAEGLEEQEPLDDGTGVRGWLGGGGTGVVLLTSSIEADVELTVSAVGSDTIGSDSQTISWTPGPVESVELGFARTPFRAVAGEPFDLDIRFEDALGNVLSDEPATVLLFDACSGALATRVEVVGEDRVPVTLTRACAENRISAYVFDQFWESEAFEVLPADLDGYAVQAAPRTVTAGDDVLVFVEAQDAYGNVIADHDADIVLADDLGGLDPDGAAGSQSCPGFVDGAQVCSASLWAAGSAVTIAASDAAGGFGEAAPIEVVPAEPDSISLRLDASLVEAGEEFGAELRVLDRYGNPVSIDPGGTDPVAFRDASGTIACRWTGAAEGSYLFACTIEGAVEAADVEVAVRGLMGTASDALEVTNGPLADVEVDPQGTQFTVGVAFILELTGYDAYGNPYLVQSDPRVDLTDPAGTMSPAQAVLGPTGSVQVSALLYDADDEMRVYASQGGVDLGASRKFDVDPAGLDAFAVDVDPWIAIDAPGMLVLTAVDAWGNAVESYAGTVAVAARGGGCADLSVSDFTDGVAREPLDCAVPTLSETLEAIDSGGYGGESDVFDVVDLDCAEGPVAALALDGDVERIVCLTAGDTLSVTADASGSVAGAAGLVVHHLSDSDGASERTLSSSTTLVYTTTGTRRVELLVVDADACADRAEAMLYVGSDDGEPTGPIEVDVSAASVATFGTVSVGVAAQDCTGDVAAGQEVLVRADLGSPAGTASGAGLRVALDASGEGSFSWNFDTGYAGSGTLYVGSDGGGALGTASVEVTGDAALPEIVSVSPSGYWLAEVNALEVVFTEPMLARTLGATQIALTGPSGVVDAAFEVSDDLETLTITPDAPIDGSAGAYSLVFATGVRDAAGNQLDGAWTDVAASYAVAFGDVPAVLPDVSSCERAPAAFRPDGDDGPGAEADEVVLTPATTASPTWWWLIVTDTDDARVRSLRQPGTDPTVAWDGRGDDGRVAPTGTYRLALRPIDSAGNIGDGCDVTVELDQHVDSP